MFARRQFLKWSGAAVTATALAPLAARTVAVPANVAAAAAVVDDPAALEAQAGGRLGVSLWHPASGRRSGHRQHERFPMCSTFKLPLAAAVLYRADQGRLSLEQRLPVRAGDIVDFSPICQRHIGKDMTVRELCRATMIRSDNTAANLLLPLLDGPAGLTALLRQLGDTVTLSARYEPEANAYAAGDPRDTTSPAAMADNLQRLVLGKVLAPASRQQLADWLIDNETGERRLRAGLSAAWRVGDKTGSNGRDTTNDVAVLWPLAGGTPWILTSYLQGAQVDSDGRDAILRRVAQWAQTQIG